MSADKVIELAKQAGFDGYVITARDSYDEPEFIVYYYSELLTFAHLIRELVLEEAAVVAENTPTCLLPTGSFLSERVAAAIRAKKE